MNDNKESVHMKLVEIYLNKEIEGLETLIRKLKKSIKSAPKGHIRVSQKGNIREFYFTYGKEGEKRNGKYMRKSELGVVQRIIQRDYEVQLLTKAEKRVGVLHKFLENYQKTNLENVYKKTNKNRRELIQTSHLPDEEYIKQWQSVTYEGNKNYKINSEIITEKGEHVRSKSEKIIADKLYMLGIPYRYEYPLVLNNGITVYPDFTILKMDTREEVYLEHFGMMDDLRYVEKAMYKLDMYARNGIYIGVSLWITFETQSSPLNTRSLAEMLKQTF